MKQTPILVLIAIFGFSVFVSACEKGRQSRQSVGSFENAKIEHNGDLTNIANIEKEKAKKKFTNLEHQIEWKFRLPFEISSHFSLINGFAVLGVETDEGKGRVYAVELESGAWVWKLNIDAPVVASFAISDDKIFFGSGKSKDSLEYGGLLYCADLHTGNILWSKKLLDACYSSPIQVNGVVYALSTYDDKSSSLFYAIDSNTGEVIWSVTAEGVSVAPPLYYDDLIYFSCGSNVYAYDKEGLRVWRYHLNGKITGSPAITGGRLYIATDSGYMACVESVMGMELWKRDYSKTDFDAVCQNAVMTKNKNTSPKPNRFTGTVFTYNGDLLICSAHYLAVLDRITGDIKRTYRVSGEFTENASPLVSGNVLYLQDSSALSLIDYSDGNKKSVLYFGDKSGIGFPVIHKSSLFVLDNSIENGLMKLSLEADGINTADVYPFNFPQKTSNQNAGTFTKIDFTYDRQEMLESDNVKHAKGDLLWEFDEKQDFITSPIVSQGRLFMVAEDSHIYCLRVTDGQILWHIPINGLLPVNPVVIGNYAYFVTKDGHLYKINTQNGIREWDKLLIEPDNVTSVSMAIYENNLIVSNFDKQAFIVDIVWGKVIDTIEFEKPITISPLIKYGSIFFIDEGGNALSYNIENKEAEWSSFIGGSYAMPTTTYGFSIFVNTQDGELLSLDSFDGHLKWAYSDGFSLSGSPISSSDYVYIGSDKGVYSLEKGISGSIGNVKWVYPVSDKIIGDLIHKHERIWGITSGSTLFCLASENGSEQWETNLNENIISPIISPDLRIFVSTLSGNIYAVHSLNGAVLWKIAINDASFTEPPLLIDNRLYLVSKGIRAYYADNDKFIRDRFNEYPLKGVKLVDDKEEDKELTNLNNTDKTGLNLKDNSHQTTYNEEYESNTRNDSTINEQNEESQKTDFDTDDIGVLEKVYSYNGYPAVNHNIAYSKMFIPIVEESGQNSLSIVDMKSYNELFSFSGIGKIVSIPTVSGSYVYFGTDANKLYSINHRTGEMVSEMGLDDTIDCSPLIINRYLYFVAGNTLYKIDAYQFKVVWAVSNIGDMIGTLTHKESKIYFTDRDGFLYCVDEGGSMLWKTRVSKGIEFNSMPVFLNDNLCIAGGDGNIYIFNSYTGILINRLHPMGEVSSELQVNDTEGFIYFVSSDGVLHCIDYNSNNMNKWLYRFGKYKTADFICVDDKKIYSIVNDGRICVLDAITGSMRSEYSIYKDIRSKPILHDGALYFTDRDNIFYRIYLDLNHRDTYPQIFGQKHSNALHD